MGISDLHVIPMIITCMLQGTLCDKGIPCTFYGGNICSVGCKLEEVLRLAVLFELQNLIQILCWWSPILINKSPLCPFFQTATKYVMWLSNREFLRSVALHDAMFVHHLFFHLLLRGFSIKAMKSSQLLGPLKYKAIQKLPGIVIRSGAWDHLFCNHFSRKLQKSGQRKVVREIWFEKSGSGKVVDQKKRWFYTINPHFFRLEKSG